MILKNKIKQNNGICDWVFSDNVFELLSNKLVKLSLSYLWNEKFTWLEER